MFQCSLKMLSRLLVTTHYSSREFSHSQKKVFKKSSSSISNTIQIVRIFFEFPIFCMQPDNSTQELEMHMLYFSGLLQLYQIRQQMSNLLFCAITCIYKFCEWPANRTRRTQRIQQTRHTRPTQLRCYKLLNFSIT